MQSTVPHDAALHTDSAEKLSLSASIVLYRTPMSGISALLAELQGAGVDKIIVVDNSPPDFDEHGDRGQPAIVERIRAGTNLGYGKAHNIALQRCVGTYKYHLICNPDISIPRRTIWRMTRFMERNLDVGLCMPKLVGADGDLHYCCRRSPVLLDYASQLLLPHTWGRRRRAALEMRSHDYHAQMDVSCLSGCFMFFRSDVLERLRGFDERFFMYFEDFDLSLRAQALARNVYFPKAQVVHGRQSAHKKSWRLRIVFAKSALQYFSKWGWFANKPAADFRHDSA